MIKILSKENRLRAAKYRSLIIDLKLNETKDIKESLSKLKDFKKSFSEYSFNDLKLMRIEVNALVEEYKQTTLLTSITTTVLAFLTIFVNLFKDYISKSAGSFSFSFSILYVAIASIMIILMISDFSKRYKDHFQLLNMIDLVIKEKEEMSELHEEAYKEYLKFIKEEGSIT